MGKINIDDNIICLKGVGAKKQERLLKLGITTVQDLLEYAPIKYRDRRAVVSIDAAQDGKTILTVGRLQRKSLRRYGGAKSIVECTFVSDNGNFVVSFFNMPYMTKSLEIGCDYSIYGKLSVVRGLRKFVNPEITKLNSANDERGLLPVYRCTQGITSKDISKLVRNALSEIESIDEWIDQDIVDKRKICDLVYEYNNLHFPKDEHHYKVSRYRSIYEKLLIYQIAVSLKKRYFEFEAGDSSIGNYNELEYSKLIDVVGFKLTEDQISAIEDIRADLSSSKPMNRLIQGDVGSGKTVVAESAILMTAMHGYQSAFMAPTEILANQHYEKIKADFDRLGARTALLVSAMSVKDKRDVLERLKDGSIDCIIGTHALIQASVEFKNLGLAITDEQHRFGVNQRKMISSKGVGVNVLVMSATPIPRTLANTVFGDMDFSIIRQKPVNRLPIITRVVSSDSRKRAYAAIRDELDKGNKAYIVCPSIDSEDGELTSVNNLYDEVKGMFKGKNISLLHGRLDKNEKDRIMKEFAYGDIDILVSTVVIEVGIDVPSASIIVIENSERFGLAQLHQLRGRVGRSNIQSYCYLVNYGKSDIALKRAELMSSCDDGFVLSEEDYNLRGPGDIMGTMQHGVVSSNTLSFMKYTDILELAKEDADIMVDRANEEKLSILEEIVSRISINDTSEVI